MVYGEVESEGGGQTCVGMKKRWKGRGASVLFGQLRGKKTKEKRLESGRRECWCGGGAVAEMEKWRGSLAAELGEEDGGPWAVALFFY